MSRRTRKVAEPVGSEELKDAILAMIVERFGERTLDRQTVEQAHRDAAHLDEGEKLIAPTSKNRCRRRPRPTDRASFDVIFS